MKFSPRALALALALLPTAAIAQPSERNREFDRLVRQAAAAYEAHDGATAIQALERAYAIRPIPRLLFNLGRAHDQASNYVAAVDYYRRFLATNPDAEAGTVAREALGIAERNIAQAQTARQQSLEDAERQRALEEARARSIEAERRRAEDERRNGSLSARPRRITVPVGVAFGVAGAGLIAGGVMGALALSSQSTFANDRSGQSRFDAAESGSTMSLGADVAFGTAIVAGVVGLVIYFTQSTSAPAGVSGP